MEGKINGQKQPLIENSFIGYCQMSSRCTAVVLSYSQKFVGILLTGKCHSYPWNSHGSYITYKGFICMSFFNLSLCAAKAACKIM